MNLLKLKGMRVSKNLTQKDIASILGMATISYSRKETGVRSFRDVEIVKLAEILNLTIDDINEIFFNNKLIKRNNKN